MKDLDLSGADFSGLSLSGSDFSDLGGSDPWGLGGGSKKSQEYSAGRSALVDVVESATGWGTEADALYRRLSGEADTFDEAHRDAMKDLKYYEEDNKYANYLSTGVGFAAGFLIPGLAASRIGTVATTAQKAGAMWKMAGYGALEGIAYGAGSGHTWEERGTGALLGAGIGGALSGGIGKFVIKSDEEIAAAATKLARQKGQGSHLGGTEGFKDIQAAPVTSSIGKSTKQAARAVFGIDNNATKLAEDEAAGGVFFNLGRGTKNWMEKHVGGRFAKLAEDAESQSRRGRFLVDHSIADDVDMKAAAAAIKGSDNLQTILVSINPQLGDDISRLSWDGALKAAKTPDEKKAIQTLQSYTKKLQMQDPRNLRVMKDGTVKYKATDYFPTTAKKEIKNTNNMATKDDYIDPIESLREYAYEIQDTLQLSNRFALDHKDIIKYANKDSNSLVEAAIKAVKAKAKRETPNINEATLRNMETGLRSQFIAARQGGNAMGSIMRRATSTALLANPLNAVLNMVEGITAPLYQNGFEAWAETVPGAIMSTFNKKAGVRAANWMDDAASGHGGQYMGELAQHSKDVFNTAKKEFTMFGLIPESATVSKGVDKVGEVAYKATGVDTVNRMGREILGNSAIKRATKLAMAGDEKSLAKLLDHDGMRGLSEREFQFTVDALKKMAKKEGKAALKPDEMMWVNNFYGAALNKWQPVSASALPKAFHDNPNGRVMYSMLSYMNRQMNNIIDDIGGEFANAAAAGLNTPAGQKAMKKAYMNGAKYAALFGVLAGTWNTARLGLDPSKDKPFAEVFTVEGMSEAAVADLVSNMSMGLLNTRSEEYGKKFGSLESIVPAPLTAASKLSSGVLEATLGDERFTKEGSESLLKAVENYVPGVSNVDRAYRMATGNRLLSDGGTGVGYLNDPLKAVGIKPTRAQGMFDDLGL